VLFACIAFWTSSSSLSTFWTECSVADINCIFISGYDCWSSVLLSGRCVPADDWPTSPEDSVVHQGAIC
jgi:hypothetical protein